MLVRPSMGLAAILPKTIKSCLSASTPLLDVILVADSGSRRKDLLHWLKKVGGMDFVIRIEGKLTVRQSGSEGLLNQTAPWWPRRLTMQWR